MFIRKIIITIGNLLMAAIEVFVRLILGYIKYIYSGLQDEIKVLKKLHFLKFKLKTTKKKKKRKKKKVKKVINSPMKGNLKMFVLGIIFTFTFIIIPIKVHQWFRELPSPELLSLKKVPQPTRILDKKERLLYEIYVDRRYEAVTLDKIPKHVINATIAVEDDNFYKHFGFNIASMIRAAKETLFTNELQGGSTITQQLIKNVLLTPERTLTRKVKEITLAVLVELRYTKEEILEMYLNNISYGGTAWGIQSASQKFFGKNVWELDLAEATLLAGLPSAPSTYSPVGKNSTAAKLRQKHTLDRMSHLKMITKEEVDQSFAEELNFVDQKEYIRAPHFVSFVRRELENKYGKRFVEFGGLTVKTTLDLDVHDAVQNIVTNEVEASERLGISNGAALVLDARDAGVLAYVGSVDYFKEDWGAFDVLSGYRQPGSSIKPVTYALALENGYTPASILKDSPVTFRVVGSAPYTPKNYDGKYRGDVTLRTALSNSLNIPAVKLASKLGPDNIVKFGKEMGLTNWDVNGSYGLSVTLGGEEVRLLDLTNVYGTFARDGEYLEVTPFESILDSNGYEIYNKNSRKSKRVLSEEVSYLIWHILSDNDARASAFGNGGPLVIPGKKVAVKTGTTDQIRDNYTLGFTPSYSVGVWVGNNDNTPLNRYLASGVTGAAPMWNKIMNVVLENTENEPMKRPEGIFTKYDERCNKSEVFVKGSKVPASLCPVEKKEEDKDKNL